MKLRPGTKLRGIKLPAELIKDVSERVDEINREHPGLDLTPEGFIALATAQLMTRDSVPRSVSILNEAWAFVEGLSAMGVPQDRVDVSEDEDNGTVAVDFPCPCGNPDCREGRRAVFGAVDQACSEHREEIADRHGTPPPELPREPPSGETLH